MGKGTEAVKSEIERDFKTQKIDVGYDISLGIVLKFSAEDRDFTVYVQVEFDEDYPHTQFRIDLRSLGRVLRASKTGKARVTEKGVVPVH